MTKSPKSPPDLYTIGGRLRWARESAGYSSPRAAALALGWNPNTYKSHENGLRRNGGLPVDIAKTYARAFNISLHWLMTGLGSRTRNSKSKQERAWEEMSEADRERALRLFDASKD